MGVSSYLGKGLRETVPPYRTAYFFGAALNSVDADGWNSTPAIVDPTTEFNLSSIQPYREVAVCVINVTNSPGGKTGFNFKWYKDQPRTLLFEFSWSYTSGEGEWVYAYSYIGWVPWEINENGAYHVDIAVSGALGYYRTINFSVVGIPVEEEPSPVSPQPVTTIIERLSEASSFFYAIYIEVRDWIWPFWLVAGLFYDLALVFNKLAWAFYYFNEWVAYITNRIAGVLTLIDIEAWFRSWADKILVAYSWVKDAPAAILRTIGDWWQSNRSTVQSWIDIAVAPFTAVKTAWDDFKYNTWPQWMAQLETLRAGWANFWDVTFPTLVSFTWLTAWWNSRLATISGLIDTAFKLRNSWWEGWQDIRQQVLTFFSDPLEWLWGKFADWFLGPER